MTTCKIFGKFPISNNNLFTFNFLAVVLNWPSLNILLESNRRNPFQTSFQLYKVEVPIRDPFRIRQQSSFLISATMTIYTMRCTLLVLLSALLSTSVFARHHSRRTAFVPKRTSVVSSLASEPTPLSTLGTSAFAAEREAQIAAQVSSLVLAATLCRGGSYYPGDDDDDRYYNDRGYGGSNDDYYSNDSSYNNDDNYYDDRGRSVCTILGETRRTRKS